MPKALRTTLSGFADLTDECTRARRHDDGNAGVAAPGERRRPGRAVRGRAYAYQRQVELIMNAPREDPRAANTRKERLATAAVLLAIAVSVCGACVVIIESSSEAPPRHASVTKVE
jgi:hypothetical protein